MFGVARESLAKFGNSRHQSLVVDAVPPRRGWRAELGLSERPSVSEGCRQAAGLLCASLDSFMSPPHPLRSSFRFE